MPAVKCNTCGDVYHLVINNNDVSCPNCGYSDIKCLTHEELDSEYQSEFFMEDSDFR